LKIASGLFCLSFTALAYFYPKPYPENYNAILIAIIGYAIGSVIYWYLEKYVIKQTFYTGSNDNYLNSLNIRNLKEKTLKISLSSEIKDYSHIYELSFEFILSNGSKTPPEKVTLDCTQLFDERGYILKPAVHSQFKAKLDEQISKKLQ
jgi:hypothetical protein